MTYRRREPFCVTVVGAVALMIFLPAAVLGLLATVILRASGRSYGTRFVEQWLSLSVWAIIPTVVAYIVVIIVLPGGGA